MSDYFKNCVILALAASDYVALAEQYPLMITAEAKNGKAEIRISGVIHEWSNSAASFRAKIEEFNKQGIKSASLYINTPGGDVFQAAEIRNEIEAFEGDIHGYGGALVASAGTYIRLACKTFEMVSNGQWMYHKPMGVVRGNEDEWESKLGLLKNITSEYRNGYADLTGLSSDQIEKKWAKGDVWLNAKQALEEGFITGISSYKSKITEKETALFTACGSPTIPKPTKQKSKPNSETDMDLKMMAVKIGLPETATQAEYDAKIAQMQASAAKAERLEQEAKQKEETERGEAIEAVKKKAIADKKILAKDADKMDKWAETDFEGWKAHMESLPTLNKLSTQIKGKAPVGGDAAAIAAKKFEDMTEEEQQLLAEEDPETFQAKYEASLDK